MGFCCYLLRGQLLDVDGTYFICVKTLAIGVTLIVIGAMGIHEAKTYLDEEQASAEEVQSSSESSLISKRGNIYITYFINGMVLGLSWDGLPSLAPTLALPTLPAALTFLLCYGIGTALFMGAVSGLLARCALLLGDVAGRRLPMSLGVVASVFSVAAGACCLSQGVLTATLAAAGPGTSSLMMYAIVACAGLCSVVCTIGLLYVYSKHSPAFADLLAPFVYFVMLSIKSLDPIILSSPSSQDAKVSHSHVHIV
jgi:hypothetical protein